MRPKLLAGGAEVGGDVVERILQLAADGVHDRDDGDRNAGRDQAVFDGGRTGLVLHKTLHKGLHGVLLDPRGCLSSVPPPPLPGRSGPLPRLSPAPCPQVNHTRKALDSAHLTGRARRSLRPWLTGPFDRRATGADVVVLVASHASRARLQLVRDFGIRSPI